MKLTATKSIGHELSVANERRVIENQISRERITFIETGADTDGELLAFDLDLGPNGHVRGAHVHPMQEERFEVQQGTMRFRKGISTLTARRGDVVVVPPGTVHGFANAGVSRPASESRCGPP
jgi:mannose-6-phosphate isomerase-like protein (cupin superfamily)